MPDSDSLGSAQRSSIVTDASGKPATQNPERSIDNAVERALAYDCFTLSKIFNMSLGSVLLIEVTPNSSCGREHCIFRSAFLQH
ncbi:hypothetical protein PHSY_003169 [Pseudozyma hubeiensis SY62]|uniref:Uncharacterized protein n=1 Tax=Pseudozyma hubeiensis (strain SY62) TaxID=1305764 RepID=R9P2G6_PSEHS|nr:hypothetical protein PHSY_003169 [Pseudozyma hubeiensis SY62]GAC95593.1 hypothetical protein PHSY_003169 [Pseudozyma hubeiensis SY62]